MNFYRLFYLFFKVLLIRILPLIFFSFLKPIELVSYYNYKNRGFVQFVTICNFIFYKCERSTQPQKFANETLYASSQISPTIFLEANKVSYIFYYTFWVAINTIWLSDFRFPLPASFLNKFVTQAQ